MNRSVITSGGHHAVIVYENHTMTSSATSPLRRVLKAQFTRRTWAELWYALVTFPLAVIAVAFIVPMLENGPFWALSAPGVRKLAAGSRALAADLLGEQVPPPPRLRPVSVVRVRTSDTARLSGLVTEAGGKARQWAFSYGRGVSVSRLSPAQITALAAGAGITLDELRPAWGRWDWYRGAALDKPTWRARLYFAAKLPLAAIGLIVVGACWLGGLFCLTFPVWWQLGLHGPIAHPGYSFLFVPAGVALLLGGPWLLHGVTEGDRLLIRGLLTPHSAAERMTALEESRAAAVDDSAARLRGIERDLHDGTQAQLVALSMKLGLAREKLAAAPVDLDRITQLVEDAHRSAVEAIADLRTVARGIHPPVLDNGLADALSTLATRSAVPVELVTDIPERPSAAIETIGYFCAAELLTNVAKHSGARHATLEAVHVPGLLRIRVTDDGRGGADAVPRGGLSGLAERVRTVDGRLEIASPRGGPTAITVELPSHA